ncbi:MAG: T9SS type A sorting domain-containing protein, partial [Bacteroidales bacterium]|nr:T9SS type A sorting domain-containing protein [Bacteroidales bacterium]
PATELTAIPFSLPQAGEATLTVMTANGQVIHRRTIQVEAGENRIELDASGWAAGVYYYTMEYKGQRIVRKMSVVR